MKELTYSLLNVLLVEDDEITNFLSTIALKEIGIEKVDAVENGELAISYINQTCPDLIFLDLNMPLMDGFEFLTYGIEKGLCPETRIAILTSSTRPSDRERAFAYRNIIDYVEKPLDAQKVEQVLAKF
ncbi:response regulator [Rapidithrix thailandica]|uniref:Response regulator n=1 Tax=Rapidithrix thailandica TaxID=413964 RepID=A0AAW9S8W7_9BACT